MTTTVTDSPQLQRLKKFVEDNYQGKNVNWYSLAWKVGSSTLSRWVQKQPKESVQKITLTDLNYHEETFGHFQLIIVERKYRWQEYREAGTNAAITSHQLPDNAVITSTGEYEESVAYAWLKDDNAPLYFLDSGAFLAGICLSPTVKSTRSKAIKILEVKGALLDNRTRITQLSSTTSYSLPDKDNPFNAVVGDEVFIHAMGRWRKGLIVKTTGSRFIVGYTTPSNNTDLRYVTVPLVELWVTK